MKMMCLLFILCFLASCGKSGTSAGLPVAEIEEEKIMLDGSNVRGLYMAKFFTLNPHINGNIPGSATIQRKEDEFFAYIRMFGGAPNAWHQQYIHEGRRCPNMNDDLNGDGYIDIEESNRVLGKVLIPLDSNIASQKAGRDVFPMADETGTYFYERVTSFDRLYSDLKQEDLEFDDNIKKLGPDEGLSIQGRVVIVHGTDETKIFPDTVATAGRWAQHQTIPVVCGVFSPVTHIPGEPYEEEETPGPIGEVEEPEPGEIDSERRERDNRGSTGYGRRRDRNRDNDDPWYERVINWWRERWNRDRGERRHNWGNGILEIFNRN